MASYHIQINEKTSLGKGVVAFLHSIPQTVTIEKLEKKQPPQNVQRVRMVK